MEPIQPPDRIVLRPADNDLAWRALWDWLLAPSSHKETPNSQDTDLSAPAGEDEVSDDDIGSSHDGPDN